MEKTLIGPVLDVTKVYSLILTQIFIAALYFSGMPILIFIASFTVGF
jgi:hypothetical protein